MSVATLEAELDQIDRWLRVAEPEDQHREYKRRYTLADDRAKLSLCSDVAAMANGGGGTIYVGIAQSSGRLSIHDQTDAIAQGQPEQITRLVRSRTDPQIDLRAQPLTHSDGKLIAIYVNARSAQPHAVRRSGAVTEGWFVQVRRGATTEHLTYSEIVEHIAAGQVASRRLLDEGRRANVALETAADQLGQSTYNTPAATSSRQRYLSAMYRADAAIESLKTELAALPDGARMRPLIDAGQQIARVFEQASRSLQDNEFNLNGPNQIAYSRSRIDEDWKGQTYRLAEAMSELSRLVAECLR